MNDATRNRSVKASASQRAAATQTPPLETIVGQAPAMQAVREQIQRLVAFDTVGNPRVPTVLLQGETGTGKDLIAHILHRHGPRASGPFIDVNCAAIPESLLESELFGFEAGAFTDAKHAKPGLFESASGGTLFLDEIDTLPLSLQAKLLKAIEEKQVRRLGAVTAQQVDVKCIAATKESLPICVTEGRFRADLYQRLAVVLVTLPPLRERDDDPITLAQHFLQQYAAAHRLRPKRFSTAAARWLCQYHWPGNVRELSHLMERVMLLHTDAVIEIDTLDQLCLPLASGESLSPMSPAGDETSSDERAQMCEALRHTGGNVARAARVLGWSRSALRYRMQRYGIRRQAWEARTAAPSGNPIRTPPNPANRRCLTSPAASSGGRPRWEQKPVAVLAITMRWTSDRATRTVRSDPWTEVRRWERVLREKVQGFGGRIIQHTSSFYLIAFGIPLALERMPQRAVQAALTLRRLATETSAASEPASDPVVRLAVHLGALLVDVGAPEATAEILAVGDTLELPIRLLGYAAAGEVLVSPQIARQVEELCELQGRQLPFPADTSAQREVYAVVRLRPRHAPWARQVGYHLHRFVGRERELATLHELLTRAEAGQGQVVGIMGEAGIGKSRFLYEFRRRLMGRRLTYLAGSCSAYTTITPYLPLLEILRRNCDIREQDGHDAIAAKVCRSLQEVGMAAEEWAPYLLHLLGVSAETAQLATLSPQALKNRTFEALLQMCLRGSQQRPIIFEIEDFHWIDATSEACIASLVDRLAHVPILLLVTYRPERRPAWMDKSYATQLALTRLDPQESRRVMDSILRRAQIPEKLAQLILAKADGNPFFLEELSRTVAEHGHAIPLRMPDTVQAVLAARIDRLPSTTKQLLQVAAVIGNNISLSLLQSLTQLPEVDLSRQLSQLQEAEFLYETRLYPDRVYAFKHVLMQEVACQLLHVNTRQHYHQRIAQALSERLPDIAATQPELLAHHYTEAGCYEQALTYWQRAGRRAYERSAHVEAINHLTKGLELLARLPETSEHAQHELRLQTALGPAFMAAKGYAAPEVERTYGRARELCQQIGDTQQLFPIFVGLWNFYFVCGKTQTACELGEHLLALAQVDQDRGRLLRAHAALGEILFHAGQFVPARHHLEQAIALYDPQQHCSHAVQIPTVACLAYTAWVLWHQGYPDQAIQRSHEARALAQDLAHPLSVAIATDLTGHVHQLRREAAAAWHQAETAWGIAREQGFPFWQASAMILGGWALALQGQCEAGMARIHAGLGAFRDTGAEVQLPCWLALLAEVYGEAGQPVEGLRVLDEALAVLEKTGERYYEAELYRLRGELVLKHGKNPTEVEDCFHRALDIARHQHAKSLELRAAVRLSRL